MEGIEMQDEGHSEEESPSQSNSTSQQYMHTSRLCVKHLPNHVSKDRLRKLFSQYGEVTDLKLMETHKGKFRGFAFVGFKTNQDAKNALAKLNNTYVDMNKIEVEFAKPYNSEELNRPWSKYSKGSSAYEEKQKKTAEKSNSGVVNSTSASEKTKKSNKNEEKLQEFLGLSKKSSNTNTFWSNDLEQKESAPVQNKPTEEKKKPVSDTEEEEDLLPQKKKAKVSKQDDATLQSSDSNLLNNQQVFSDLDYLQSKTVDSIEEEKPTEEKEASTEKSIKEEDFSDNIMETGRIFFTNLPYHTTEEDITDVCKTFGELTEVFVPLNSQTNQTKGVAYVTFMIPEQAKKAMDTLNNSIFQGRLIYVVPARTKRKMEVENVTNYKKKLQLKKKDDSNSSHNWNPLFVNKEAVLDQTAAKLNVSKRDMLLDNSTTNQAVRVAIAETEVLKTIKDTLLEAGIDVDAIKVSENGGHNVSIVTNPNRSNTCMLVKNLPAQVTEAELEELFSPFGNLQRVVLISNILAVVQFVEPSHARTAFRKLAYKKFKHSPLYLEWAPVTQKQTTTTTSKNSTNSSAKVLDGVVKIKEQIVDKSSADDSQTSATLFVKNLNFKTKEENLMQFIVSNLQTLLNTSEDASSYVRKVTIARKSNGDSYGYGFVELLNLKIASLCMENLQSKILDNHALYFAYSSLKNKPGNNSKDSDEKIEFTDEEGRKVTFKKITVKNLAFEATRRDLQQLFGTYGTVKEVRVPQKVSGGHRGFAFVEFATPKECHQAYEALKNSHLYGRKLVLEFAADENETNVDLVKERNQIKSSKGPISEKKRKREEKQ